MGDLNGDYASKLQSRERIERKRRSIDRDTIFVDICRYRCLSLLLVLFEKRKEKKKNVTAREEITS